MSLETQKFREFLKENYENVVSPDPIVRKITLSTFINTFGNGLFMTTGIIYFSLIVGLGAQKVALAFSLSGALSLLLSIPSGHFADRYPPRLIAFSALIGMGLNTVTAAAVLIFAMVVHVIGELLASTGSWSIAFELADQNRQGAYQGLWRMGFGGMNVIGPSLVIFFALALAKLAG